MNAVTKYLASIGSQGGKATSKAKAEAAKANGKLGGRPKKTQKAKKRSPSGSNDQRQARAEKGADDTID